MQWHSQHPAQWNWENESQIVFQHDYWCNPTIFNLSILTICVHLYTFMGFQYMFLTEFRCCVFTFLVGANNGLQLIHKSLWIHAHQSHPSQQLIIPSSHTHATSCKQNHSSIQSTHHPLISSHCFIKVPWVSSLLSDPQIHHSWLLNPFVFSWAAARVSLLQFEWSSGGGGRGLTHSQGTQIGFCTPPFLGTFFSQTPSLVVVPILKQMFVHRAWWM